MVGLDSFNTVLSFLFLHSISLFIFLYPTINKDQINKINKYYWSIKFCISYWKCYFLICNISRNYNSICRPSQNKIIFTVIFTGISIVLQNFFNFLCSNISCLICYLFFKINIRCFITMSYIGITKSLSLILSICVLFISLMKLVNGAQFLKISINIAYLSICNCLLLAVIVPLTVMYVSL